MRTILCGAAALGILTLPALADCTPPAELDALAANWEAKKPSTTMKHANMEEAFCARDKLVEKLGASQGKVIGYKAGLTNAKVQERFGTNAPVAGVLMEKMILDDGAAVPANWGARPVWEADLLLVVKDDGINAAKTPEEALAHISAFRPFIELPDLVFGPDEKLDGLQLTAINVGARLGVAGKETPLENNAETIRALADMKVAAKGADGAVLAEGQGAATLGNPLNAVVWLVGDLAKSGKKLAAGDLISVGSFTPLTPPKSGQKITVNYEGLPGNPSVSVAFE